MTQHDLSALVSARLCHDLISPLGAIGNGLELLQMTTGAGVEEFDLISDSLGTALAKLRFYRIAFGPADPEARLALDEAAEITRAMYGGRLSVVWESGRGDLPRTLVKMTYLAILCLEKSLPMGGLVRVSPGEEICALAVEGRPTAAQADLWAHVTDGRPLPGLRPDGVQFPLLRQALAAADRTLRADFTADSVALRMTARSPLPA